MSEQKDISGKILPQDIDAERSVLGALMIDPIASNDVFGKLKAAHLPSIARESLRGYCWAGRGKRASRRDHSGLGLRSKR